jgi:hypothetical protein
MHTKARTLYHWICGLLLGSGNAAGWLAGPESGAQATAWSVGLLILLGVVVRAIGEIGRAFNTFWEERERLKIKLQAERDKADETSLSAQLMHVRESLHNLNNQANISNLRHAAEADRLTKQLDITYEELHAAREQIRSLEERLAKPLARIAVKQEAQGRQLAVNTQAIKDVAGASGVMEAIRPPDDPTDKG